MRTHAQDRGVVLRHQRRRQRRRRLVHVTELHRLRRPRDGVRVTVVLDRKVDGVLKIVARKRPTLSATSRYTATFARPPTGQCRMRVTFRGDGDHLGSRAAKGFAC